MTQIYGLFERTKIDIKRSRFLFPVTHQYIVKENHPELENILERTKGLKVGIELEGPSKKLKLEDNITAEDPEIYTTILERLEPKNEICYLDDISSLVDAANEYARKVMSGEYTFRDQFSWKVKQQYEVRIKRSKTIAKTIKEEQPDIAFIGAAHAWDLKQMGLDGVEEIFIEVPENRDEVIAAIRSIYMNSSNEGDINKKLQGLEIVYKFYHSNDMPSLLIDDYEKLRKQNFGYQRLYNTITEGTLEKRKRNPDYIGTWDINIPARGFFELYVEREKEGIAIGRILDCIGNSKFEGIFNQNTVKFIKRYTDDFGIMGGAIKGPIEYEGHGLKEVFIGNYSIGISLGGFILSKYSPKIQDIIIGAKDSEEILKLLHNI